MRSFFQDLSNIGINPLSVCCLQEVSKGAYMITFSDPQGRGFFSHKSSFISRSSQKIVTVSIYDAPFELPDRALKQRLSSHGSVHKISRGRYQAYFHVETGVRFARMCIDKPIPSPCAHMVP